MMPMTLRFRCLACATLLGLALGSLQLQGAERRASGRDTYRQQCAKCHGKNGQGVKGKYDDALVGDWSIEKLTRYIDKNMPEDAPEKCVGEAAGTVARYINDAFYSREARVRNQPPRVELARLTNRQYANTVADLLKSFTAPDDPLGHERGLRGNYREPRREDGERESLQRLDRKVDFDFLREGSEPAAGLTNRFSGDWRGSIIAEEAGEYEFILKTPNGARLWVNDETTPLIDASVASGTDHEQKAALRLLGGRVYPLRLEWFKAPKDKLASIALLWKPPHGVPELIPARCLTPARATPTLVVTTPFPPDDSSVGYERGVAVSKAWDEAATQAAIEVANFVAKNLDRLIQGSRRREEAEATPRTGERDRLLTSAATNRAAKAQVFCEQFVEAAFRRPLTAQQKRVFVANQFKGAPKTEDAVKRVVLLALKSPRFLYLGLGSGRTDDFDVAARLSFALWDSLPDRELTKLAAAGALRTREQVGAQARRLLGDPRARAKMQSFLHHWLQVDHIETLAKDDKLFPGFTPEIIADLRTSLNLFLDDVVWSEASDYRRLLLEDDLFVNDRLARFYAVETDATDDFVKVPIEPKQRSGVLTHPYLLAAFSYPRSTSPIHRGVFLTRNIIGRALKPPPMAVAFKESDFSADMTMREKVAELTRPQACQSCHSVINPLGFSLEHFDAVGRLRTKEGDRPIDTVSDYTTDDGKTVRLTGARDVAQFAVGSRPAQDGFVEQLFHQLVKQPILAYGPEVQERLRQSFAASGFNVQNLMVEIATVAAVHGIEKPSGTKAKGSMASAKEGG
jgi:hypothetical protein